MLKISIQLLLIPVCGVASFFLMAHATFAGLGHGRHEMEYFVSAVFATTVAIVCWLLTLYQMWSGLPDDQARTTPVKAVALMLIPIFNLYWLFQVVWGFAKDYNAFLCATQNQSQTSQRASLFVVLHFDSGQCDSLFWILGDHSEHAAVLFFDSVAGESCGAFARHEMNRWTVS